MIPMELLSFFASTRARAGLLSVLAVLMLGLCSLQASASNSAVVFMYHRFGESDMPSTNIQISQLKEHLKELKSGGYKVLPLGKVVEAMRKGEDLPDRTVAITVDDAYRSLYTKAWPLFKEAGIPITLFVATDTVDLGGKKYMNWDQIRELQKAGVTIGSQTKSHPHMTEISLEMVKAELDQANARIKSELGETPTLFAYPYGEYSRAVRDIVARRGFVAAFGQNSGVVYPGLDPQGLPRFALNETYGGIDRFRLAANALPMLASDILPKDPLIKDNPPAFGFTVARELKGIEQLACFASGQGRVRIERLERRVEVRLRETFPPGRARINCTMPGPNGRWRWFGVQFVIRE